MGTPPNMLPNFVATLCRSHFVDSSIIPSWKNLVPHSHAATLRRRPPSKSAICIPQSAMQTPHGLAHFRTGNREHHQIWMLPGGAVHVSWTHGAPDVPTSPTGYMYSLDYGTNWGRTEIAINTGNAANLRHGLVADTNWVHIIAEPGAGTYARRPAPRRPQFSAIEQQRTA